MTENEKIVQEYCNQNGIDFDFFVDGIDYFGNNHRTNAPAEIIKATKLMLQENACDMLGI